MLARLAQPERLRLERQRLERIAADLAVPLGERLSERRRAQTLGVLSDLFGVIEGRLKAALSSALLALGAAGRAAAAAMPGDGAVWRRVEPVVLAPPLGLVEAALARATEHGFVPAPWSPPSSDGELAQRLVALELAEAARLDAFGEPRLPLAELDEAEGARAAWLAAAALRAELLAAHPLDEIELDLALEAAVRRLLAEPAAGDVEGAAAAVARRLDTLRLIDADLLASLADSGRVALLIAVVARRLEVEAGLVRKLLLAPDPAAWSLLVQALDAPADIAASLSSLPAAHADGPGQGRQVPATPPLAEARRQLARWRRDARLVAAIDALGPA